MIARRTTITVTTLAAIASAARAEVATFYFADVGNSYSAFLPPDDPLVGQEITQTRIYLYLDVTAGDASQFLTDISFPIEPDAGNESALVLTGEELGWEGNGHFEFTETTERFNGEFISRRYGAETPGFGYDGVILDGSRIEFEYIPEPASGVLMLVGLGLHRLARRAS